MATKDELESQLEQARNDIEALTRMAAQTARESVESGAADLLDHLSEDTRALYDSARSEGAKLRQATERSVRNNPLGALGLSFLAGALFFGLLNRR